MNIEIMAKTASDSGHIDLSDVPFITAENSGPVPIPMRIRAGALFLFRGGMDKLLVKSPELLGIGYKENNTGFDFLHLKFTKIPLELLEFFEGIEHLDPVFVIVKMEEEKTNKMLIGPGRVWDQALYVKGILQTSETDIILAGTKGTKKRS